MLTLEVVIGQIQARDRRLVFLEPCSDFRPILDAGTTLPRERDIDGCRLVLSSPGNQTEPLLVFQVLSFVLVAGIAAVEDFDQSYQSEPLQLADDPDMLFPFLGLIRGTNRKGDPVDQRGTFDARLKR